MTTRQRKPKLSGAQRRKQARQSAEPTQVLAGDVLKREPQYVTNRLMTVLEWRRQIGLLYREARAGKLRSDEATRFVYIAEIGARLAKMAEELESIEALRQQLAQVQNAPAARIGRDVLNGAADLTIHESQE